MGSLQYYSWYVIIASAAVRQQPLSEYILSKISFPIVQQTVDTAIMKLFNVVRIYAIMTWKYITYYTLMRRSYWLTFDSPHKRAIRLELWSSLYCQPVEQVVVDSQVASDLRNHDAHVISLKMLFHLGNKLFTDEWEPKLLNPPVTACAEHMNVCSIMSLHGWG